MGKDVRVQKQHYDRSRNLQDYGLIDNSKFEKLAGSNSFKSPSSDDLLRRTSGNPNGARVGRVLRLAENFSVRWTSTPENVILYAGGKVLSVGLYGVTLCCWSHGCLLV